MNNIFVVGLDPFHLSQLQGMQHADAYCFHPLLSYSELKQVDRFPVRYLLQHAKDTFQQFQGPIDAVVGYWDFPVSTMLPLIREQAGLHRGPNLVSVLKCEHKYWSRLVQREVVPDLIPPFEQVDPFNPHAVNQCSLHYPFWLKPVKSVLSHLGFLVRSPEDFSHCLEYTRGHIGRYAEPFNFIMGHAELPAAIKKIDGYHCIAEGLISQGRQCTLEGHSYNGNVEIYGIVDSLREGACLSSFSSYIYPSDLPGQVQQRMVDAAQKVITHTGYDNAPFNIEFYWNQEDDTIHLLEINTRISKSHCPLFKMVDGEYHHQVMLDLALGRAPDFPKGLGKFQTGAKFMLRCFHDGRVAAVPEKDDLEQVYNKYPGTEILLHIHPGMRLSELRDQDSYSYETAVLFMGADNRQNLLMHYADALKMLPFRIDYDGEIP